MHAAVEDSIDAALDAAGFTVRDVRLPGWNATHDTLDTIIVAELWKAHHTLLDADGVGDFVNGGLRAGRAVSATQLNTAMAARAAWQTEVAAALVEVDVLALPTLVAPPPLWTDFAGFPLTTLTGPFSLAGVPAISMPVPSPGVPVPVSLQLVGPMYGEGLLCTTALKIETVLDHTTSTG